MGKKEKQEEFAGMPERGPLGDAAMSYLEKDRAFQKAREARDEAKSALVAEFVKNADKKITSLTVEGKTINYSHQEKDVVTVKNANEG